MTTVLLSCRVADYDTWRPLYDRTVHDLGELRSWRIWRGQDDPNLVVVEETFDSRDVPERLLASAEIQEEMASHGVDASSVQIHFLDEVGSGSH
jgi:hypothetical protein